jgi:hypothetical protein
MASSEPTRPQPTTMICTLSSDHIVRFSCNFAETS